MKAMTVVPPLTGPGSRVMAPPSAAALSRTEAQVAATCESVRAKAAKLGGAITREAGPVKGGSTVIAFITDPDGYKIELIERR